MARLVLPHVIVCVDALAGTRRYCAAVPTDDKDFDMAQRPIEDGFSGKAPNVAVVLPRAQRKLLRELASARGLTVSGLLRVMITQALDVVQQGDDLTMQKAQDGSRSVPGSLNAYAGTRRPKHTNERSDPQCPTSPRISAPTVT
jgi:hypothetical protein